MTARARHSTCKAKLRTDHFKGGGSTAGLPSSNTSVGRFVRAVYYAQFAEKAATPDLAVHTLAHVMNNFDRPRGITIDYPDGDGSHLELKGLAEGEAAPYATEFTCWTSLSDLDRKLFFVRNYGSLNYTCVELPALAGSKVPTVVPMRKFFGAVTDATPLLKSSAAG